MNRTDIRHYTEEELLLHLLREETPEIGVDIDDHAARCAECAGILAEYRAVVARTAAWRVPDLPEAEWQLSKTSLLAVVRQESMQRVRSAPWRAVAETLRSLWDYALEHPLPSLAYVAVALAFALERTIHYLQLEQILPQTGEVIQILSQVL